MEQEAAQERDENVEEEEEVQERPERSKGYFLELGLLFLFTGNNMVQTLLQNQLIKMTCFSMGYNHSICDIINQNNNSTKDVEEKIQPYVANINLLISLLHTILPAILSLFLGNWSDKYGRRKVLCSTFIGYFITLTLFAVVCYYSEYIHPLPPWAYVICYAPAIFSGGWPSLLTAALCYITDTCDQSSRSKHLTIIELIIFLGVLVGTFSCSYILELTDAPTVFCISATFAAFALFIVIFLVDESLNTNLNHSTMQKVKSLFSPTLLVKVLQTCFKRRSFKGRRILLLLILIMAFLVFTFNGGNIVGYLFVRLKFSWTLQQNNLYDCYSIVCSLVGSVIGFSVLRKLLKLSDMNLACIALFCGIVDPILKAFAYQTWHMYAITSLTLFRILASPMLRTMISSIVPQDEIGKVFSITTSFEALSTFAASPLYTYVYKSTITTFPGAFFFITASVNVINLLIALYIIYLKKIRESLINPYERIENN